MEGARTAVAAELSPLAQQTALQEEIAQWLLTRGDRPQRYDTNAAIVILAGARAYKMKRARSFAWMDFSTLAQREAACRSELALNRLTAPQLYECVLPVVRQGASFALSEEGPALEWLVVMQRFPDAARWDLLLAAGGVTPPLVRRLVDRLWQAQAEAPVDREAEGLSRVVAENAADFETLGALLPPADTARLNDATARQLARHTALLQARQAAGLVRHCHGDLHLRNIVQLGEEPTPFDCVEFSRAIATTDVLYDFAFLLMDLDFRGRRDLANVAAGRYFEQAPLAGLALLPLFLSLRAAVRAKVEALALSGLPLEQQRQGASDAQNYLQAALAYLSPPAPRLLAVGGFSGSGKSSFAQALAPFIGAAPGALLIRSDVVRKRLFGVAPEVRLPLEAYSAEWHGRVAATMLEQADVALRAGHSVILDAVHSLPQQRSTTAALAVRLGVAFQGFWLEAPAALLRQRVGQRQGDASDATLDVLERQLQFAAPVDDWSTLDASLPLEAMVAQAQGRL